MFFPWCAKFYRLGFSLSFFHKMSREQAACQSVLPNIGSLLVWLLSLSTGDSTEKNDQHVHAWGDTLHQSGALWQNHTLLVFILAFTPQIAHNSHRLCSHPGAISISQSARPGCDSSMMETVNWPSWCVRAVIDSTEKERKGSMVCKCNTPALLIQICTALLNKLGKLWPIAIIWGENDRAD